MKWLVVDVLSVFQCTTFSYPYRVGLTKEANKSWKSGREICKIAQF